MEAILKPGTYTMPTGRSITSGEIEARLADGPCECILCGADFTLEIAFYEMPESVRRQLGVSDDSAAILPFRICVGCKTLKEAREEVEILILDRIAEDMARSRRN